MKKRLWQETAGGLVGNILVYHQFVNNLSYDVKLVDLWTAIAFKCDVCTVRCYGGD
jgi:hypothetical protein